MENFKKNHSKETATAYANISPIIKQLEYIDKFRLNSPFSELIEQMDKFRLNSPFSELIEQMDKFRLNSPFSELIEQMDEFRLNLPFSELNGHFDYLTNTEALFKAFENITSESQENFNNIIFDDFDLESINEDDKSNLDKIMDEIFDLRKSNKDLDNKLTNINSSLANQYDVQLYLFLLNLLLIYFIELIKMQS